MRKANDGGVGASRSPGELRNLWGVGDTTMTTHELDIRTKLRHALDAHRAAYEDELSPVKANTKLKVMQERS